MASYNIVPFFAAGIYANGPALQNVPIFASSVRAADELARALPDVCLSYTQKVRHPNMYLLYLSFGFANIVHTIVFVVHS